MCKKTSLFRIFFLLLAVLLVSSSASARPLAAAAVTAFTYQGRLYEGGLPANGRYDLEFSLYNALGDGTQVGPTVRSENVTITDGLFTVLLDFGNVFDGTTLYLQVGVRPGGSGDPATLLTPRQLLSATPYALYTLNADQLDGQQGSYYRNATNLNAGTLGAAFYSAYADLVAEGYIGNSADDLARNNGTLQATLNADSLDGYHAGNTAASIPINNSNLNTNLNADLLDSQQGTFYRNAANINAGMLGTNFYSAWDDLITEGYDLALNNGILQTDLNADKLDGLHAPGFATADHNHWGQTWNGTDTGLTLSGGNTGLSGSGDTYGVYGSSSNTGVYGTGGPYGIYGSGATYGIYGSSDNIGVYGFGSRFGVIGESSNNRGVTGSGPIGVYGQASLSGYGIIGSAYNGIGNYAGYFQGNVSIEGNMTATGTKSALVKTKDYGQRSLYAVESPENWFEDFGTGQLLNGAALITIEPVFAQTVNLSEDYHVFLTPICEAPVLLFVTQKTPTGFSVSGVTLDNQPSRCAFDYRITAKRLGYEDVRLVEVDPVSPINLPVE